MTTPAQRFRAAVFEDFIITPLMVPLKALSRSTLSILTNDGARGLTLDAIGPSGAGMGVRLFEALGWARAGIACGYLAEEWLDDLAGRLRGLAAIVSLEGQFAEVLGLTAAPFWPPSIPVYADALADYMERLQDEDVVDYINLLYFSNSVVWESRITEVDGFVSTFESSPGAHFEEHVIDRQSWFLHGDELGITADTPSRWMLDWAAPHRYESLGLELGTAYTVRLLSRAKSIAALRRRLDAAMSVIAADSGALSSVEVRSFMARLTRIVESRVDSPVARASVRETPLTRAGTDVADEGIGGDRGTGQ
jgi:hypothetical protein